MSLRRTRNIASVVGLLLLASCGAVQHLAPAQAVYRIEDREGGLHLIPPSLPGGVVASPIPFSQIIVAQYGFNPWEQYVDLSQDMRLAVQRMTGQTTTDNTYYGIASAGRRGYQVRSMTPQTEFFNKHAKYVRLFYQTKFVKSPGQPLRPALFLWSDSPDRLKARTVEARENPGFSCGDPDCLAFPGKTIVTPEVEIVVNQKPRYVVLGSSVRDVLRSDRVAETADLRLSRKYRNYRVPVTWQQKSFVLALPLVAGDEISW
jgi:hypothetical protein